MTADIYVRDTKDMLMASKDLPNVYGASSPKTNAANLRTKGWEASISWNDSFNLKGKAFHYSVVLGLADNTTKVTMITKHWALHMKDNNWERFGDMLLMVSSKLMKKLKTIR